MTVNSEIAGLPSVVSEAEAAELLGCTPRALKRAVRWGYVPEPNASGHATAALVAGWIAYLKSSEVSVPELAEVLGCPASVSPV